MPRCHPSAFRPFYPLRFNQRSFPGHPCMFRESVQQTVVQLTRQASHRSRYRRHTVALTCQPPRISAGPCPTSRIAGGVGDGGGITASRISAGSTVLQRAVRVHPVSPSYPLAMPVMVQTTDRKISKRAANRSRSGRSRSRKGRWMTWPSSDFRASRTGPSCWDRSCGETCRR